MMMMMMMNTSISFRTYRGGQSAHSHAHHQVILPLEGRMSLETGREAGFVDALRGAIVVAGERHAFESVGCNRFLILDVSDAGDQALWDAASHDSFFAFGAGLNGLLQYAGTAGARAAGAPEHARALAGLLLQGIGAEVLGLDRAEPAQLRRALALIHSDYAKPLTVGAIARQAGASASTLTRLFQSHLGRAPAAYLTDLRLARARDLLEQSAYSIAEIAQRCGYGDQAALTRAFRRRLDVTPAHLRRRLGRTAAGQAAPEETR